jgi:hypothetical protein
MANWRFACELASVLTSVGGDDKRTFNVRRGRVRSDYERHRVHIEPASER